MAAPYKQQEGNLKKKVLSEWEVILWTLLEWNATKKFDLYETLGHPVEAENQNRDGWSLINNPMMVCTAIHQKDTYSNNSW